MQWSTFWNAAISNEIALVRRTTSKSMEFTPAKIKKVNKKKAITAKKVLQSAKYLEECRNWCKWYAAFKLIYFRDYKVAVDKIPEFNILIQ